MKILISGSNGMIGNAFLREAESAGDTIIHLVRPASPATADSVVWDISRSALDPASLEGLDAVVHLAGENIAGRWTAAKKDRIRDSRVLGTSLLCGALAGLKNPPQVLVCASAIGYYGDRGDEILADTAPAGTGFLADTCRDWEAAAEPALQAGIRVVHLRIGVVLDRAGGALAGMLLPFRLGLGGRIGSGRQYMSWVSLGDAVGIFRHALETESLSGPVNAVAPAPVTNGAFTRALGMVLRRPTVFPMPAFAARLAFGEMAEALLLASTRVVPALLQESGYRFLHPDIDTALRHTLNR
jgi:uncharacterized protein (TIGR01777 family)